MNYVAIHPYAILTYCKSDMPLAVHSDASYLSNPKARSRDDGYFPLSNDAPIPTKNGVVLNIAQLIKAVRPT